MRLGERFESFFLDMFAIIWIDPANVDRLLIVVTHFVIEHDVMNHPNAVLVQNLARLFERGLVAIFCRDCSLLVELFEIEQIVSHLVIYSHSTVRRFNSTQEQAPDCRNLTVKSRDTPTPRWRTVHRRARSANRIDHSDRVAWLAGKSTTSS